MGKVRVEIIERPVPARAFTATIQCHSVSARPFDYTRKASGTVRFEPEAGTRYLVNGSIRDDEVSVWIEVADTHQKVTTAVSQRQ